MSHGIRKGRRFVPLAAGAVALAALWACDGQNFFAPGAGGTTDTAGPVVQIQEPRQPAARPVGEPVTIVARATDDTGVDSLLFTGVAFRGNPDLGTDTVVSRYEPKMVRFDQPTRDTVITRELFATADNSREAALLYAIAYDSQGNISADTVALTIGGPKVEFLTITENLQVQSGLSLNLQVDVMDPEGILDLIIDITGVFETEIEYPFNPPTDTVSVDTAVVIPEGLVGDIQITATARNGLGVSGQDGPITLHIVDFQVGDAVPPEVSVSPTANARLELTDPVSVVVSAADNTQGSGIARVGYTVIGISPRRDTTEVLSEDTTYSPARTGTTTRAFEFLPFNVDELNLPDTLVYEVTGWAYDGDGNCSAAMIADTLLTLPCTTLATGETVADLRTGVRMTRTMVSGRTIHLPSGGRIMDAAVDTLRRNLLLSNMLRNQVEIFNLNTEAFENYAIGVGAEPWGMTMDLSGDTLLVANSGGVNVSKVDLAQIPMREVEQQRFFAPDAVIFDLELREGDSGFSFVVWEYPRPASPSFADRPQYIAVDSFGSLVFSTRTTSVGDVGTVRKAYFPEAEGARSETKLFVEHGLNNPADDWWAIAHIDSIVGGTELVTTESGFTYYAAALSLFDHVPGFPDQIIQASANYSSVDPVETATSFLAAGGSDIYIDAAAVWNIPNFGYADTTFVTASGDEGWVLIGEGGVGPTGRVMMYRAAPGAISDLSATLRVWDEVINAADVVRGVGLNYDGTLGVARGESAYFFDQELQLNGRVELPGAGGGSGASLHPLHANQRTLENFDGEYRPDTHIAFVGTADGTIDIIDTFKFTRIGQITLRDVISGPLRAILPFPEDNAGLNCPTMPVLDQAGNTIGNATQLYQGGEFTQPIPVGGITDEACVVVKLFAITSAEGVVVVPIRKTDIFKYHPNR